MINIYKASAGSGKTFTLVKEYLKLLLGKKGEDGKYTLDGHPKDNHRPILAITFTNKATDEMKKRIVKELDTLADPEKESPYMDFLTEGLNAPAEKIRRSAQTALRQLLQDFTNFNVSTIDTFFQKILRTFAYESNLSGNYGVELNDEYAIAVGVSDLKQSLRLNKGKNSRLLLGWLERFILSNISEGKSWDIFRTDTGKSNRTTLASFAKDISKEIVRQHRQPLFDFISGKDKIADFSKTLDEEIKRLSLDVKKDAAAICGILSAPGVKPNANFLNCMNKIKDAAVPTSLKQLSTKEEKDDYISKYIGSEKLVNKASAPIPETEVMGLLERIDDAFVRIRSFRLILDNIYFLGLLGDIDANILQFTKENNVILLSGTNEMLQRIINADDTPFIYERIGMKLSNFLIDEFQDTSRMQWRNLRPLLENSVAGNNDNLVIGDVKQSIYRFRNSDPELLRSQIKTDFKYSYTESGDDAKGNTNWRSAANVVTWNNRFFSWLAKDLGMEDIYSNVVQNISYGNKDKPGHVSAVELAGEKTEDFQAAATARLLDDLNSLLDRGYEQKDIAIITNTNTDGQTVIDRILKWNNSPESGERSLNVVSEESLLVCKSPAVRIIVSILAMLDNSGISDAGKAAERKSLPLILKQYEINLNSGMNSSEAFADAIEKGGAEACNISDMFGEGECAGLDTIAEQIIRTQLSPELTEASTPYIQAFMDCLTDFMSRYGSNIHSFLKWWDNQKENLSISSPDNINAIRVMTIHKSKGLEFPCVILPFFSWNFDRMGLEWIKTEGLSGFPEGTEMPPLLPVKRTNKRTIFEREFERLRKENVMDSLNKTYVACTRAVNELLIYYQGASKQQNESAKAISRFVSRPQIEGLEYTGTGNVELGKPTVKTASVKTGKEPVEERRMPSYKVSYNPDIWHFESPDIIEEIRGTKRYQGKVLHRIMCKIRTAGDIGYVFRMFTAKGFISQEEAEEYRSIITRGLADKQAASWFATGNRLLTERTIVNAGGEVYRPDRVVCRPDGSITVIDYKFGERQDKKYSRQVRNYMSIIQKSVGAGTTVSGYIWYVQENTIIPV